MATAEGNPSLFMRCKAQNATGVSGELNTAHILFFHCWVSLCCFHMDTVIYTCYRTSIHPVCCFFGLAELQLLERDLGRAERAAGRCVYGASLFYVEEIISSACCGSRNGIRCSGYTKLTLKCNVKCQAMDACGAENHIIWAGELRWCDVFKLFTLSAKRSGQQGEHTDGTKWHISSFIYPQIIENIQHHCNLVGWF